MGTFLDFIMTSKELLKNCLELCDSLENDLNSESLSVNVKEQKLDILIQDFKILENNVKDARKIRIKLRTNAKSKKQDGDQYIENGDINKEDLNICENDDGAIHSKKINDTVNDINEDDVSILNNIAKEAILNEIDSEISDSVPSLKKCSVVLKCCGLEDHYVDKENEVDLDESSKSESIFIDDKLLKNYAIITEIVHCEKEVSELVPDNSHTVSDNGHTRTKEPCIDLPMSGILVDDVNNKNITLHVDIADEHTTDASTKKSICSITKESRIDLSIPDIAIDDVTSECIMANVNNFNDEDSLNCSNKNVMKNVQSKPNESCGDLSESDNAAVSVISEDIFSEHIMDVSNTTSDDAQQEADILVSESSRIEELSYKDLVVQECCVVLEDISKRGKKITTDEDSLNDLEKEVDKLSQIPKFKNKKKMKNDDVPRKKSRIERRATNSDKKAQSESEENNSDSNSNQSDCEEIRDRTSDIEITVDPMIDSNISSTDSESSNDEFKTYSKQVKNGKSAYKNLPQRRITRSLKIPIMSDSEESRKTGISNGKSSKKIKTARAVVCVSSTSTGESDASASDLRKMSSNKRKKTTKSIGKSKKRKVESDEDDRGETRKKIHKVIDKSKLSEATKTAEQYEKDRRKRIEEKQEMYNNSLINKDAANDKSVSSLILEKDEDGKPIVEVHQIIAEKLKDHQIDAVQFMYGCVIEGIECLKQSQAGKGDEKPSSAIGGCILAHCMGLGKTLSLIAFMHTMLTTPVLNFFTCIVVCPVNTALNWKREWEMWMPAKMPVKIFEVCSSGTKQFKMSVVQDWYKKGGVLIIGYEMFRLLSTADKRTIRNKIMREKLLEALIDPGADFMVCDEGHLLKNEKSAISKVINKIKTKCRIVLTGTPLQNKLLEYHTMVNFVKPNLLGTQKEFLNRFVNPISNGQHINSTQYDVQVMKKRSHILFKTLDGCVHRKDYSALVKYLPPKYEYVIKIRMSEVQRDLYKAYLSLIRINRQSLFQDQMTLSRIWTHPFLICMHQVIQSKKTFVTDTDEDSFLTDGSGNESEENHKKKLSKKPLVENNVISLLSDDSDHAEVDITEEALVNELDKKDEAEDSNSSVEEVVRNWSTTSRKGRLNQLNDSDDETKTNFELENLKETVEDKHWWSDIIKPEHEHQIEISGKLTVLFQILRKAGEMGDKVIIFTQSLLVLDLIEKYLLELHTIAEKVNEDLQNLNETLPDDAPTMDKTNEFLSEVGYNTWQKGYDYDRMDGSTMITTRADIQARFNTDRRLRLFLISTRAGGMGVNLISANRVVIFDVSWNPSNDIQAIFRSYRFGQVKPVYVYRLVSQATMEEKMYERQVTKLSVALRVVDEQQVSRYFTEEDLRSLYKFEPDIFDPEAERETPILPKDRFLAELIKEFPQWIYGYHEHDSLLQNKDEEELTEDERRDAWKEFEDEKVHGNRHVSNSIPGNVDSPQFAQSNINQMFQQYPQYAPLYAQNFVNLLRYALNQQPELKANPAQLGIRMQAIFFASLQKYHNTMAAGANPAVPPAVAPTVARPAGAPVAIRPAVDKANNGSTSQKTE